MSVKVPLGINNENKEDKAKLESQGTLNLHLLVDKLFYDNQHLSKFNWKTHRELLKEARVLLGKLKVMPGKDFKMIINESRQRAEQQVYQVLKTHDGLTAEAKEKLVRLGKEQIVKAGHEIAYWLEKFYKVKMGSSK